MKRVTYINLILGVWLLAAPAVFGAFTTNRIAATNDLAVGVLLIATSWWIVAEVRAAPGPRIPAALWHLAHRRAVRLAVQRVRASDPERRGRRRARRDRQRLGDVDAVAGAAQGCVKLARSGLRG